MCSALLLDSSERGTPDVAPTMASPRISAAVHFDSSCFRAWIALCVGPPDRDSEVKLLEKQRQMHTASVLLLEH